jgi:dTDP-4-amino-4,6-dideoxygalactose transaminase
MGTIPIITNMANSNERINVTKTYLPDLSVYSTHLQEAWNARWLTNRGKLTERLEESIKSNYSTVGLLLLNNGTTPIQFALKSLQKGEIITTPFTYIATSAAIKWEGHEPVFVDIDKDTWTIDVQLIEEKITPKTRAILATHVFGNPCAIEELEIIAKKHNIDLIFDAAHSFGVTYRNQSIFNYGDVSTCSFHATKLFHTGEGGAFFSKFPNKLREAFLQHNFGHIDNLNFEGIGINGKLSELQAAMGLSILPIVPELIHLRSIISSNYFEQLNPNKYCTIRLREETNWNHSYFPVLLKSETELLSVELRLNQQNIFPRRYFYPSLSKLNFLNPTSCPVSEDVASRILCLPIYHDLTEMQQERIIHILNN